MKSPLGRVMGLGSAREGTEDFFKDRLRAVLLMFLTPFMIFLGVWLFGRSRDEVVGALSSLWIAPAVFVFMALAILHMRLGMQTIIEDYVHHKGMKVTLLFLNWAFCLAITASVFLSLIRIFFQQI
ncbi:succinate dehydrogenase, hydrophobic membrane anchor protein [Rhizobium sp. L1K21]|uniref:succinate dehydrogenase, hydrophobic membrane anchor protein n=1 Tax=Rhizobium sp. L1K21 TaxID=2954933 RepID=UPI002093A481|nr:succinate dehydrogenase, hydrophobic membrane anchor protein [Rhizobium sp. L1K21]MCO6187835.1 succinate dehydrogenase, hydrophobic membrane anchor protein [Rhizobium sp. L1K21]